MATLIIAGQIKLLNADTPIQNLKVELWDSVSGGYGLLGSTVTEIGGVFVFSLDEPIVGLITSDTILLKHKVYSNSVVIYEELIPDYSIDTEITIAEAILDGSLFDDFIGEKTPAFLTISGKIKDRNGALAPGIKVNVYETVFPTKKFIGRTTTDVTGSYALKINKRLISNSTVLVKRGLVVEAEDNETIPNVTTSTNLFGWDDKETIVVDFSIETANPQPEYGYLVDAIMAIVDTTPLAELTPAQVEYIAGATGKSELAIANLVLASAVSEEASLPADYFFAFLQLGNGNMNSFISLKPADALRLIETAKTLNLIQNYTEMEVDSFLADFKTYQVEKTKEIPITNESYTMNEVFDAIFPTPTDKDNFLSLYLTDFESMPEFWNDIYIPAYGEEAARNAQQGLKLIAVTYYQPKIMARLRTEIAAFDTPHISQLAKWDQDTWTALISNVCTIEDELCVPAVIRGEENEPDNTAIHEQYALKMMDVMQMTYPLTNIAGVLEGDDGETLIANEDIRAKVATFINNNPLLDLRSSSIHDINSESFVVDEEDIADIKNNIASFQRILRLVGGNPVAVCSLIADGVDSAKSIASMGKEQFQERYGDLFPPDNRTEGEPLYHPHVSGGFGGGLSAGGVFGGAYSVSYATALGLSSGVIDSLYSGPVFPPTFPGGYTTLPSDYPVLSSLFGGMDYCNCCDCKSILSPAAYLTDVLHFLQTKAPAVYAALQDKRPDIVNIDLSCKNSDTPVPYIDLVIELLELQILKPIAAEPITETLQCHTILKPVMQVAPNVTGDPYVLGYYSYNFKGTPEFINVYPLSDVYMTSNYIRYQTADRFVDELAYEIGEQVGVPWMYDKLIQYHITFAAGTEDMLIWSDLTGTGGMSGSGGTATFIDSESNEAIVAPFVILDHGSQNVIDYLIADISIEVVSSSSSAVVLKLTRHHNPASSPLVVAISMYWLEVADGGVPDALDPNVTVVTLAPGNHTLGVGADYTIADYEGETVVTSKITMVIKIDLPTYIPGGHFPGFSFQTDGTPDQLLAYPEHIYKDPVSGEYKDYTQYAEGIPYKSIYDSNNLGGAVYPHSLPFSLPIEETRTYLEHFGISRFNLMKLFKPVNQATGFPAASDSITDYSLYAEWLGVSLVAASIITGSHPSLPTFLWTFYGLSIDTSEEADPGDLIIRDPSSYFFLSTTTGTWQNLLSSRLDILLQQAALSYEELIQILSTDYINPLNTASIARKVSITPIPAVPPDTPTPVDTCRLDKLRLSFSDLEYQDDFYRKLHRFIRLLRTGKLTIYQWDILLRSMMFTDIDDDSFMKIGRILLLADELKITPEVLACWWANIDTTIYHDLVSGSNNKFPSIYAQVFSDKAVLNYDNINPFKNPLDLPAAFISGTPPISYLAQIANMCGIEEGEVILLLGYFGVVDMTTTVVTLNQLSRLYILSVLAAGWNYKIKDFIKILK